MDEKQIILAVLPAIIRAYPEKIAMDQVDMALEIAEYLSIKYPEPVIAKQ